MRKPLRTKAEAHMARPVRLQLSRRRGFDLQALSAALNGLPAVKVARPSLWGNPFIIGSPSGCKFQDGGDPTPLIASLSREQAIEFYRKALRGFLSPEMHPWGHRWYEAFRRRLNCSPSEWLSTLRGKNLGCFCKPGDACHADVLLEMANRPGGALAYALGEAASAATHVKVED